MRYLLIFLTLLSSALSAQVNYYVSPSGNDANAGTLVQPWKTVQYALDNAVAGCTIYLMGGNYSENAVVTVSGTSSAPIRLTNYNGENAVINGNLSIGGPLLSISNKHHFKVDGIEFANYSRNNAQGILVDGTSHHIEIRNNRIHNINFSVNAADVPNANTNAQPLIVNGNHATISMTNIVISGNEIYECRTGFSEALAVNGNVDGFVISKNKVHDNTNIGIDIIGHEGVCANAANDQARNGEVTWNKTWNNVSPYTASAGIYVDGARLCVISNNSSYGNGYGIEVGCEAVTHSATYITVSSNLVYRNLEGGIVIGGYDFPVNSGKVNFCSVRNNTIFENNVSASSSGEIVEHYTEDCVFSSNIVYTNGAGLLFNSDFNAASSVYNFNLYYSTSSPAWKWNGVSVNSLSSWAAACSGESASIFADPQMVNASGLNFHLQSTSPAIDAGDSAFVATSAETDIDTMSRLQNARVDIGADEFGTAVGIALHSFQPAASVVYDAIAEKVNVMFPSPAKSASSVQILDMNGNIVAVKEFKKGETEIQISMASFAKGTYLVYCSNFDLATKFVK